MQRNTRSDDRTETAPDQGLRIGITSATRSATRKASTATGSSRRSGADDGGICVSPVAHDQVKGRLDAGFEDLGPQAFDDRRDPLHAYRITLHSLSGDHD